MFHHRSAKKELLDGSDIPFEHIKQNMQELDVINRLLGGHRITLKGLETLIQKIPANEPISIVEIGCGDGNNLRVIKRWAEKKRIAIALHGVDHNQACIDYALSLPQNKGIKFTCADYRHARFDIKPHIIFSSLFCHHFTNDELLQQLQWMHQTALIGFFINDLHRHPVAYYSIKALTTSFSKSYLVKHDAPLSVLRGFTKREWQKLLHEANIKDAKCRWEWAFRWLITSVAPAK